MRFLVDAREHEAVVITKDEDFAELVARAPDAPTVVWIRVGNTTRRALLEWLDPKLDQIVTMIESGDRLVELR